MDFVEFCPVAQILDKRRKNMKKPLFTISILNWNGKHLLNDAIGSALKQSYKPIEVILVDNGSSDGSVEFVKKRFGKKVRIVMLKENKGYAGGHNAGFKKANGKWVALMSNDVTLPGNWASEVMKSAGKNHEAGIIAAPLKISEKKVIFGNYFDMLGITAQCNDLKAKELMTASGGIFAVNKKLFSKPYDEDYFIYGDEAYLATRCLLKKMKVITCPEAGYFVQGLGSESSKKLGQRTVFLTERNDLINFFRFLQIKTIFLLLPILLFHFFASKFLYLVFSGKFDYLFCRGKAWLWVLKNAGVIYKKRRETQKEIVASDRVLFNPFINAEISESGINGYVLKAYQSYIRFILPLI